MHAWQISHCPSYSATCKPWPASVAPSGFGVQAGAVDGVLAAMARSPYRRTIVVLGFWQNSGSGRQQILRLTGKKPPASGGWRFCGCILNGLLMLAVVFVAIDLARQLVLLTIDLLALRLRQLAAVGRAVVPHFPVDFGLFALQVRGFAGGELSAFHTLRDAVLLIFRAFPHFAPGNGVLRRGVVLVLINLPGNLILLLVERGFVGRG